MSADKLDILLKQFKASNSTTLEICVQDLGWLILLKEDIELVSDNWFSSAKYAASEIKPLGEACAIECKNIYKVNVSHVENAYNPKYNLLYNTLTIYMDKIIAFF